MCVFEYELLTYDRNCHARKGGTDLMAVCAFVSLKLYEIFVAEICGALRFKDCKMRAPVNENTGWKSHRMVYNDGPRGSLEKSTGAKHSVCDIFEREKYEQGPTVLGGRRKNTEEKLRCGQKNDFLINKRRRDIRGEIPNQQKEDRDGDGRQCPFPASVEMRGINSTMEEVRVSR